MSSECIGCLKDCSKVLVAPARIVKHEQIPEVVKKEALEVKALLGDEDVGMTSAVKCRVTEDEEGTSIITCGW
jgi:hypothetical protein